MIPYIVKHGRAFAHRFEKSCVRSGAEASPYWRDVGTVDAYWQANIDLTEIVPDLDLYDRDWPIWTYAEVTPPAKFVHDIEAGAARRSPRSSRAAASSRAGWRGIRCCSPACTCIPTRCSMARWCCPMSISAAARG